MGEVLQFRPRVSSASDSTGIKPWMDIHKPSISTDSFGGKTFHGYVDNEDLYPVREQLNPSLHMAIKLLKEAIEIVNESIKMFLEDDFISSDDALQRFQALLPELFCCRVLGDGFGSIINSLFHSIGNINNKPTNEIQLNALLRILKRLHSEPFIRFDEAVEEILYLEEVGFEVSPPHLEYVADLLNG